MSKSKGKPSVDLFTNLYDCSGKMTQLPLGGRMHTPPCTVYAYFLYLLVVMSPKMLRFDVVHLVRA